MKTNLITLAISLTVLVVTLLASRGITTPSAHSRYYITAVVMISGLLAAITLLRLLLSVRHRPSSAGPAPREISNQRREHYRLTFEQSTAPLFVQTNDEGLPADAVTCPVRDISETGLTLRCSGVYPTGQTVHGEIIFASGRTAEVNGTVIREEMDRTSLKLHCTIDPALLMTEQRELIESQKSAGPRPAVSHSTLEESAVSLPSHRPKGVCHIK
jgi:hypothetical protein